MLCSIKYFEEIIIKKFEELEKNFVNDPSKLSDLVMSTAEEVHKLGIRFIQECLEETDQLIRESVVRKMNWDVERTSRKSLITSLGTVQFTKTLFVNKENNKSVYLLDKLMKMAPHERITEDAVARILEESVESSYRRGGEEVSLEDKVSKQTVKRVLHNLRFPEENEEIVEKKVVEYLYLEADEDHIALQFQDTKGDLQVNDYGRKNNGLIAKLIYVHEGLEPESILNEGTESERASKRWKLINPHYFGYTSSDKTNEELWDEVYKWIDRHYDLEKVKKIYLNADGGSWIQGGSKCFKDLIYVLDGFHLQQYMIRLTSHLQDSVDDARKEIYEAIKNNSKKKFEETVEKCKDALKDPRGEKRIEDSRRYILENWNAARNRVCREEGILGSTTEGHVYHVYSTRMSTKPLGWSKKGASQMARLRVYYKNNGNMMELAKYQRAEYKKAVGMEETILSSAELNLWEKSVKNEDGKYIDCITHSIPDEIKKLSFMKAILGDRLGSLL